MIFELEEEGRGNQLLYQLRQEKTDLSRMIQLMTFRNWRITWESRVPERERAAKAWTKLNYYKLTILTMATYPAVPPKSQVEALHWRSFRKVQDHNHFFLWMIFLRERRTDRLASPILWAWRTWACRISRDL